MHPGLLPEMGVGCVIPDRETDAGAKEVEDQ